MQLFRLTPSLFNCHMIFLCVCTLCYMLMTHTCILYLFVIVLSRLRQWYNIHSMCGWLQHATVLWFLRLNLGSVDDSYGHVRLISQTQIISTNSRCSGHTERYTGHTGGAVELCHTSLNSCCYTGHIMGMLLAVYSWGIDRTSVV